MSYKNVYFLRRKITQYNAKNFNLHWRIYHFKIHQKQTIINPTELLKNADSGVVITFYIIRLKLSI